MALPRTLTLSCERVVLRDWREADAAVAERLGAAYEGVRHRSHEAGGRWWDMAIYSLRPDQMQTARG